MSKKSNRSKPSGSLRVDRSFPGIGRIQVRTGTSNRRVRDAMDAMLVDLHQRGQFDLLHAVRGGTLDIRDLYRRNQRRELTGIIVVEDLRPLSDALEDFVAKASISEQTRKTYRSCFKLLVESRPDASVSQLFEVLTQYRIACEARGVGRNFNLTKAACQSFVSRTYGPAHSLWIAIKTIRPLTTPHASRRKGSAREVSEVVQVVKNMRPELGQMFWTMCISGMGNAEYFSTPWEVILPDRLHIHGEKRPTRNRLVPLVQANMVRPAITVKYLGQELRKVAPEGWQLYDGRRCFAHWCLQAGIPKPRITAYMGHKTREMTDLYLRHNVIPYLGADAELLRTYIADHKEAPVLTPVPAAPWSVI